MAFANRAPTAGLVHHSDRGSQYVATSYQRLPTGYSLIPSMSRTSNCWDNACVESFRRTLRHEACLPSALYHTRRSPAGHLRIPRGVLQSATSALNARLSLPGRVRSEGGCRVTRCPRNRGKISRELRSARQVSSFPHLVTRSKEEDSCNQGSIYDLELIVHRRKDHTKRYIVECRVHSPIFACCCIFYTYSEISIGITIAHP